MLKLPEEMPAESPGSGMEAGSTVIFPVDAFVGTVTRMVVLLDMVKSEALTLPNITPAEAVKLRPLMTTFVPGRLLAGAKLVIETEPK